MRIEIYAEKTEAETKSIKDNAETNLSKLWTGSSYLIEEHGSWQRASVNLMDNRFQWARVNCVFKEREKNRNRDASPTKFMARL